MKEKIKTLKKDEEAVSPVIGVILMVAITVIMAAIVAGFVFGVISTPEATPQASITVDDYTTDVVDDNDINGSITLLHQSGDSLNVSDLTVTINGTSISSNNFNWGTATWEPGTTATIELDGTVAKIFENEDYSVRIIHQPSGNAIASPTFTAN